MIWKLDMQHQGLKLYKVYVNDVLRLTLTFSRQGQIGSTRLNGENCYKVICSKGLN